MWPNTPFPPPSRAMKPSDWTPCFADQVNDLMDKRADLSFPSPSDTHSPTCFFGLPPRMGSIRSSAVRFAADSAPEGDGFEPSVPHKKTTLFGCPRSVPQFAFRNKNRLFRAGTDGSNPSPSSSESGANLQTPLAVATSRAGVVEIAARCPAGANRSNHLVAHLDGDACATNRYCTTGRACARRL